MIRLLIETLTSWTVPVSSESHLESAEVIATHEFGDQKEVSKPTEAMARIAISIRDKYQKPWIAQYPGNCVAIDPPVVVIREHLLKRGAYLDTEEVNRQIAEFCKAHGWKKVILITHPHHAWRAGKNLEHHGLEVIFPDLTSVKYDPHSTRRELASSLMYAPREIIARLIYLAKGYFAKS